MPPTTIAVLGNHRIRHHEVKWQNYMLDHPEEYALEKAAPQPKYTTSGCCDPKLCELAEMARSASAVAEADKPKEN